MAVRLYTNAGATTQLTTDSSTRTSLTENATVIGQRQLWLKADDVSPVNYNRIIIRGIGSTAAIYSQYALDNAGTPGVFYDELELGAGTYQTAVSVWRRFIIAHITSNVTGYTAITHEVRAYA